MVLARNQNGQLIFVNGNFLASSSATSTSTVLVTQSLTSGAITTLKNSTSVAVSQPIVVRIHSVFYMKNRCLVFLYITNLHSLHNHHLL